MGQAELISQLKIERNAAVEAPEPRARNLRPLLLGGGAALAILMLSGGAFAVVQLRPPEVEVATAVSSAPVAAAKDASLLDASGYVVARRRATVSSQVTGRVVDVLIDEGQTVQAGQIIARLDADDAEAEVARTTAELSAAAAAVRVAQVDVSAAQPKYERARRLAAEGFLSAQGLETAEAARSLATSRLELSRRQEAAAAAAVAISRRRLDDTIVRAPFAGIVTEKAAQPGEIVSPISAGGGFTRTGIGTIVDMDSLEVQVDVAESFIHRVQAGMPARVTLNAYPDWAIPASVIAVVPAADRSKATVSVRIRLNVKDARIIPDMGAKVAFLANEAADPVGPEPLKGVWVPAQAVRVATDAGPTLFVVDGETIKQKRVRLGPMEADRQLVVAGLTPGEQVVTVGPTTLQDGERVRVRAANSTDQRRTGE
jgi:RND family efflux transporter MFP subunit